MAIRLSAFSLATSFLLIFLGITAYGQSDVRLRIMPAAKAMKIDGSLDEWPLESRDAVSSFRQYFPFDTGTSLSQSMVWMAYDSNYLYIAARLLNHEESDYVAQSLKRDYREDNIDDFTVVIDPFNDRNNGFFFSVSPFNVQREGLISNGGTIPADFDLSWDNKWYSSARKERKGWTLEIAIPFRTLRFSKANRVWGLNFIRNDTRINEKSVWSRVPRQFEPFNLAFTGEAEYVGPFKPSTNKLSLIPYAIASSRSDFEKASGTRATASMGADVKVAVTPSLNLDLTVNPDFSQVEVDNQQANLDRFELFFPERRQFFLENADLFSNYGFLNSRPFFSRRIGIGFDRTARQYVLNKIIGGLRLSGRLNNDWRVGMLSMQTQGDEATDQPETNFTSMVLQRRVFARSNVSAIFVNKQVIDDSSKWRGAYNRLFGLDYNVASSDGRLSGKVFYHHSLTDGKTAEKAYSHGVSLLYSKLRYFVSWTHQTIGEDFDAQVGFVPRTGFSRVNPSFGLNFYPSSGIVNRYQYVLSNNSVWNRKFGLTDNNLSATFNVLFRSSAVFNFSLLSNYVKLFAPFNPTGDPSMLFQPGESFRQNGFLASYQTNPRKPFSTLLQVISGRFYNGTLRQLSGRMVYRRDEHLVLGMTYSLNRIDLTQGFKDATLAVIGPSVDVTFNNKLFWTSYFQFNTQINNFNIYSRLQWRFKPASDAFIVYSDNYFMTPFKVRNRSIVIKLNYWLNL
jgi:hypothetical protein